MALEDRVAVITGAAGGLGRAVAAELAGAGMRLALIGTRPDRLAALATELALGERGLGHAANLRHTDDAHAAIEAVVARFGRVDVLVHAVGGYAGGTPLVDVADADVEQMLDQHLWTTINVVRAVLPHLTAAGWGRIIGVSTPIAATPVARMAPYAIAKAAQEALLLTVAREVAGTGVTANVIQVRAIDADHERDRAPTSKNASWTTPEEIAAAVRYLCSDPAGVINGARLPMFGGG